MSKVQISPRLRRRMVPAVIALLLCAVAGCTTEQQQEFSTFAEDLFRNVIAALAL